MKFAILFLAQSCICVLASNHGVNDLSRLRHRAAEIDESVNTVLLRRSPGAGFSMPSSSRSSRDQPSSDRQWRFPPPGTAGPPGRANSPDKSTPAARPAQLNTNLSPGGSAPGSAQSPNANIIFMDQYMRQGIAPPRGHPPPLDTKRAKMIQSFHGLDRYPQKDDALYSTKSMIESDKVSRAAAKRVTDAAKLVPPEAELTPRPESVARAKAAASQQRKETNSQLRKLKAWDGKTFDANLVRDVDMAKLAGRRDYVAHRDYAMAHHTVANEAHAEGRFIDEARSVGSTERIRTLALSRKTRVDAQVARVKNAYQQDLHKGQSIEPWGHVDTHLKLQAERQKVAEGNHVAANIAYQSTKLQYPHSDSDSEDEVFNPARGIRRF